MSSLPWELWGTIDDADEEDHALYVVEACAIGGARRSKKVVDAMNTGDRPAKHSCDGTNEHDMP